MRILSDRQLTVYRSFITTYLYILKFHCHSFECPSFVFLSQPPSRNFILHKRSVYFNLKSKSLFHPLPTIWGFLYTKKQRQSFCHCFNHYIIHSKNQTVYLSLTIRISTILRLILLYIVLLFALPIDFYVLRKQSFYVVQLLVGKTAVFAFYFNFPLN